MSQPGTTNILFVCLGNICRSPTAEGVFRGLAQARGMLDSLHIDSAGTGAWHAGEPPDRRAQAAALKRGYDLSAQRARKVRDSDYEEFDLILAMDMANLHDLRSECPEYAQRKLRLFLEFADGISDREVPDPYYGAGDGFETVLDLVESASEGLLMHLMSSE